MSGGVSDLQGLQRLLRLTPQAQEHALDLRFRGKHDDEACVVVAGGPSVADCDLRELLPCRFIAVNAVNWLDRFDPVREHFAAGILLDEALLLRELRRVARIVDYPLFVGNTPRDCDALFEYLSTLGIHRIPCNHTEGLGDSFARFSNGGNSGYAAFQLAVIMGFRTIGLLGFDGQVDGDPAYFHQEYGSENVPSTHASAAHFAEWCTLLDASAPLAELMGVTVLNLSARSALHGFPKVDAAGWRTAVEAARAAPPPPAPAYILRERFQGRVRLPFPMPVASPPQAPASCFGGARNTADPARYRPLAKELEDLVGANGPTWFELLSSEEPESTIPAPERRASRVALAALSTLERAPELVESWMGAALQRACPGVQAFDLPSWLSKEHAEGGARRAVTLRTAKEDASTLASALEWLCGAVSTLTCAVRSDEPWSEDREALNSFLRPFVRDWVIIEYCVFGDWLSLSLQPLEY